MNKHFDVEKLFGDKLQSYEQETSAKFDKAMERKIEHLHRLKYLKWIIGGVLMIGLILVIPFTIDSQDSDEAQITETFSSTSSHKESIEELEVKTEKPTNEEVPKMVDQEIAIEPSTINEIIQKEEQIIIERKEVLPEIPERANSPNYLINHLVINQFDLNKSAIELKEKQKESPTSLFDENFPVKKDTKKLKENEARKKEKESNYKQYQEEKEKTKKRKQPKIKKQKIPGVYEGAIEFSAAPIFIKNLSPPLEPENDTVTNWLTNKGFKTSYDFGLEFMIKQKESNWLLKTGLHYQRLSEDVNYYFLREYMDEKLNHWIYDSIFEYHTDPPGIDTVFVGIDSTYYEHWERSETSQKYINHYQYLNIPVLLGYQIDLRKPTTDPDFKKGFDIHVLAGTGIGILLKSKGYYYDTDGYIYPYPTSQKIEIDWYLNTQIAINYHWKNISLFAKPKLQFQMRNHLFDNYFENRHYLIYGMDFGIRINILFKRTPKRDKLTTKHI